MKKDTRLIIFLASLLIFAWKGNSYYSSTLEKNWNIVIPKFSFYEEVYSNSGKASFFGDGVRYHMFSYRNDNYIDLWLRWEEKEKGTRHYSSFREATDDWLEKLEVSSDLYPDYDNCLYYYERDNLDEIIIYWDSSKKMIYIVESFI